MKSRFVTLAAVAAVLIAEVVCTQAYAKKPTEEQIQAIRDCAAEKGLDLPDPADQPKLSKAQKVILEECSRENRVAPPPPPPPTHEPK